LHIDFVQYSGIQSSNLVTFESDREGACSIGAELQTVAHNPRSVIPERTLRTTCMMYSYSHPASLSPFFHDPIASFSCVERDMHTVWRAQKLRKYTAESGDAQSMGKVKLPLGRRK
jgi:hypothetical protein